MEGLDPVLPPLPLSGEQPLHTTAHQWSRAQQRAPSARERALPGGRGSTAPVIGMVFPGIENRLIYLTLPQPLEGSDPVPAAPETALQCCTNRVITVVAQGSLHSSGSNVSHTPLPPDFLRAVILAGFEEAGAMQHQGQAVRWAGARLQRPAEGKP